MSKRVAIVENCKECPFLQGEFGNTINVKCTKLNLTGLVEDLWNACPLPKYEVCKEDMYPLKKEGLASHKYDSRGKWRLW